MKFGEIQKELENYIDLEKKEYLPKFFKTKERQYGYGDSFLGITVPNIRKVAKNNINISFNIIEELLQSKWH